MTILRRTTTALLGAFISMLLLTVTLPLPTQTGTAQADPIVPVTGTEDGFTINFATMPDAVPQARLMWDSDLGIVDPGAPNGPCLLQPTGFRSGLPLNEYYVNGRMGSSSEMAQPAVVTTNLDPRSPCSTDQNPEEPPRGFSTDLGHYLNAVGALGADNQNPEAPQGELYVEPQSVRWALQQCSLQETRFEPGATSQSGLRLSRAVTFCVPMGPPVDVSASLSVDTTGGSISTQFEQPRLGTLFPAQIGASWIVSCLQMDIIEFRADGSERYYPAMTSHDWFLLSSSSLDATALSVALNPSTWYDLSGDNGCPFPPPPPSPPSNPVKCGQSTLRAVGVQSSSPNANYDGVVETFFTLGAGRNLIGERMDAPTVQIQSHNDDPTLNLHKWHLQAIDSGMHRVHYNVRTSCPWPEGGAPESLTLDFIMREPGSRCATNGNTMGPSTSDWVIGFYTYPAGMTTGSNYNTGTVVHTDTVLKFATVRVSHLTEDVFVRGTSDDPNVKWCELDGLAFVNFTPNDPSYSSQYGPQQIRAPQAWDTTLGTTAKNLCIVDTGIRYTHQDLAGARWLGGYDFVNSDADPWDDQGHGTHVAGIAGATTNNALGIAGISQSGIKAVKVLGSSGSGAWSWVASGIRWCADNGGDVINLSLGGSGAGTAVLNAVNYAWSTKGKVVVAAAGNSGPCTNCVIEPAKFANTIAVACTTNTEAQCSFSSEGPEVDLAAPGNGVLAPCFTSNTAYCPKSGTSMSTPHVAGAAALIWSHVPGLSNTLVRQYLECKAKDLGTAGTDVKFGKGLVQVKESLDAAIAGTCTVPCTASLSVTGARHGSAYQGGATVRLTHSASYHATGYSITASPSYSYGVSSAGHDAWHVHGSSDYGTRRVTFTVNVPVCGPISISFYIYN